MVQNYFDTRTRQLVTIEASLAKVSKSVANMGGIVRVVGYVTIAIGVAMGLVTMLAFTATYAGSSTAVSGVIAGLTFMLAAAADATATPAPPRHHGFTKVMDGVSFATPRARRTSWVLESFPRDPSVQACHDSGAGSGGEKMVKRMSATLI